MEEGKVKVEETGSVNQLSIDNNSDDYIFIHSGDIVKGGKQDRTIAHDVIIPPKSQDVPLQSFCVESGRWQQRASEDVKAFGSNTKLLSSKKLKLAARYKRDQSEVWQKVDEQQGELNKNVSILNGYETDVTSEVSKSSLQLTLESDELKKAKVDLERSFDGLIENNENVIGYAYAINGEILGVDIYNNKELFKELWPKIQESIITEAISNYQKNNTLTVSEKDISEFISAINNSNPEHTDEKINKSTRLKTTENKMGNISFETIDKDENQWLHINYMLKDSDNAENKKNSNQDIMQQQLIR